jgi:hypothetical protein
MTKGSWKKIVQTQRNTAESELSKFYQIGTKAEVQLIMRELAKNPEPYRVN